MIEKLDKHLASNINSCNMAQNIMVAHTAIEKINELVDVINNKQKQINTHEFQIADLYDRLNRVRAIIMCKSGIDILADPENIQTNIQGRPTNMYAVCPAVKYMGKVCRFWNGNNGKKFKNIGVLIEILSADNKRRYVCASKPRKRFEYCEPVRPDDIIIYKE